MIAGRSGVLSVSCLRVMVKSANVDPAFKRVLGS